jgi:hypothetical protein
VAGLNRLSTGGVICRIHTNISLVVGRVCKAINLVVGVIRWLHEVVIGLCYKDTIIVILNLLFLLFTKFSVTQFFQLKIKDVSMLT